MLIRNTLLGLFAGAAFVGTASASPTIITDHINARWYNQTTATGTYSDFLGANFDTKQIEIERTAGQIAFTLVTKKSQAEQSTANLADIFFDTGNPAAPGSWNFAVTLGYQGVSKGVYRIDAPTDYATSFDIWKTKSGYYYGGAFCDFSISGACGNTASEFAAPTRLLNVDLDPVAGLTVEFTAASVTSGDGFYHHSLSISGSENLLDTYFASFDFFWGTADCGNDPIWGQVTTTSVPEPASLALLGVGLAAVGFVRRRRA